MRVLVFFDLPVVKAEDRKCAVQFRNFLIKDGYDMLQFSVYSRICNGNDAVEKHLKRIKKELPSKGSIRAMVVTEKQYAGMEILVGTKTKSEKQINTSQLILL